MDRRTMVTGALAGAAGWAVLVRRPRPAAADSGWEALIRDAALRHGVDGDWLVEVARCESGLDPAAVGIHGEIGIFQFMPATFAAWGCTDVNDPYEQIDLAAWAFSQGLACGHWVCAGCGLEPL